MEHSEATRMFVTAVGTMCVVCVGVAYGSVIMLQPELPASPVGMAMAAMVLVLLHWLVNGFAVHLFAGKVSDGSWVDFLGASGISLAVATFVPALLGMLWVVMGPESDPTFAGPLGYFIDVVVGLPAVVWAYGLRPQEAVVSLLLGRLVGFVLDIFVIGFFVCSLSAAVM